MKGKMQKHLYGISGREEYLALKILKKRAEKKKRAERFIKKTDKELEELNQAMGDFDQDQS
jgi:hypothetical protein